MNEDNKYQYTPLQEPMPITEQVWPEGTQPLVHTRTMTFMHEDYIRDCIEGILMQKTTFPVQVLIHDDASTDNTAEIVREYESQYPNLLKSYYQNENSHSQKDKSIKLKMREPFYAWRIGKYEALCEGDDYWTHPHKLQRQVDLMEHEPAISLCFHLTRTYNEISRKSKVKKPAWHRRKRVMNPRYVIRTNGPFIATCSMLLRRDYIHSLPPWYASAPTGDWTTKLSMASQGPIGFIDDVMAVYRQNAHNSWSNIEKDMEWHANHFSKCVDCLALFNECTSSRFSREVRGNIRRRLAWYFLSVCRQLSPTERFAFIIKHPSVLTSPALAKHCYRLLGY